MLNFLKSLSLTYTSTEDNDLTIFKQNWNNTIADRMIFGDKRYSDFEYFNNLRKQSKNIEMFSPVKTIKRLSEQERQRNKTYKNLFSTVISKIRQPVGYFFNRLKALINFPLTFKTGINSIL